MFRVRMYVKQLPEKVSMKTKNEKIMKTQEVKKDLEFLAAFSLTNDEMSAVRGGGGDGDPINPPTTPPIKL